MMKMIIQMDENKIEKEKRYTVDQINRTLDKVFDQVGCSCTIKEGVREYAGDDSPKEFGEFGRVYSALKHAPWFIENASKWLLLEDDLGDPNDLNEEDLLKHIQQKYALGI